MALRSQWLATMPAPRATTLLVEEIPEGKNTEAEMRRYFDELVFRRPSVRMVHIVKDTSELDPLMDRLKVLQLELEKKGPEKPSIMAEVAGLEASTKILQEQIDSTDDLNTFNAFVTFRDRQDATIALKIFSPDDEEEVVATVPPAPEDVIWKDLLADPLRQAFRDYLGSACILGLFFSFLPCIVGLSAITDLDNLTGKYPQFKAFVATHPAFEALWNGLLGGVAIIIMMSMLPTFLMIVFRAFWVNKGECFLQQRLQYYYFWFLIVFVLLITAVGSSLIETSAKLIEHPTMVFALLANTLPHSTHFYLNYLPIQWTTHAIGLTRNSTLVKFFLKKRFYEERRALELAEPEDQDYFGMGSRSARFTLTMVIVLVFSTLSPLITVLGFVEFFLGRIVYSYLFMFAEGRKADLGGAFFVQQLKNVQHGLFIFIALMTGVLLERTDTAYPGAIVALCFPFMIFTYRKFNDVFKWEDLELNMLRDAASKEAHETNGHYKQPSLPEPEGQEGFRMPSIATSNELYKVMNILQSRIGRC